MPKSTMLAKLYKRLVKWFIRKFWPWFVENIWPEIQKLVTEVFVTVAASVKDSILQWLEGRRKGQEESAKQKAEAAAQKAEMSQDQAEAERYRAIAQVWREVAEEFRCENESMKAKLEEIIKQSASEFRQELNSLKIDDIVQEGENNTLKLKGSTVILQLPEPQDK